VKVKEQEKLLVFRANLGFNSKPEVLMKVEKLVTDAVAKIGVPTNKILYVDVSRNTYKFDFQIEEMLEGDDLEDHFSGTKEAYDNMSFELGQLTAKIHTIQYPKFGKFNEVSAVKNILEGTKETFYEYLTTRLTHDLEYLVKAEVINTKKYDNIIKVFEEYQSIINIGQGVLVHHDLADHNIMFSDNKITGIFDWEACVIGDPVLDLASCPTWKTHYPREEKLLEGYFFISSKPDHFEEKMNIYRLRTMLWKMVYAIRANILDDVRKQKFYNALAPFGL
jgi:aminoglycoside phosphotransferase (APT) family kinase protein